MPSSKDAVLEYTERQREKILSDIESDDFTPPEDKTKASSNPSATRTLIGAEETEETIIPKTSASYVSFQATVTRFLSDVMLLGTLTVSRICDVWVTFSLLVTYQ